MSIEGESIPEKRRERVLVLRQHELAGLLGRSQSWICRQQKLAVDPLPVDLLGAVRWAHARGWVRGWDLTVSGEQE